MEKLQVSVEVTVNESYGVSIGIKAKDVGYMLMSMTGQRESGDNTEREGQLLGHTCEQIEQSHYRITWDDIT